MCRSIPIKVRLLNGVITGGYAHPLYSRAAMLSLWKEGMLMKSKHCTYGEKITLCNFNNYHFNDIVPHKSTITASGKTVIA